MNVSDVSPNIALSVLSSVLFYHFFLSHPPSSTMWYHQLSDITTLSRRLVSQTAFFSILSRLKKMCSLGPLRAPLPCSPCYKELRASERGNITVFVKRKTRRRDQRPKIWPMFRAFVPCSWVFENQKRWLAARSKVMEYGRECVCVRACVRACVRWEGVFEDK